MDISEIAIRKLSRLYKTFRIIQKISSLSRNFPGYPETFWTIQKIFTLSGNFPKGPETSHCNFRGYAQKLSGRAKTFRMAMPPCHPGFWASGQRVGAAPPPVRLSMVEISEEDAQYHGCVYLFEKHLNDTSYLTFALELVSSSLTFKLP